MQIQTEQQGNVTVVRPSGSVDTSTRHVLGEFECLRSAEGSVVLELTDVDFMDSAGLSTLVQIIRGFRASEHKMALVSPPKHVRKLLEMTSIDQIVPIIEDLDEAVRLVSES